MQQIPGQLNDAERNIIRTWLRSLSRIQNVVEVGTWKGGGSTLHILEELQKLQAGHLWGIEADAGIYAEMLENLRKAVPEGLCYFTPLFGFSQKVLPRLLAEKIKAEEINLVFLDGGDSPREQIDEFNMLAPHIPVGGILLSHDAKLRKGKFLVPYVTALDNWQCRLHDVSREGLFEARKIAAVPGAASLRTARKILREKRRQPIELMAAVTPSPVARIILNFLPDYWRGRLAGGVK